jgi:hypothetical protein
MSKLLAININKSGADDFDYVSQVLDDPKGIVMKGHSAIVLIADDADNESTAFALDYFAAHLRDDGVRELFAGADIPES